MSEWALLVVGAALGYAIGTRWPRRRLYTTARASMSVIPPGARSMPGDSQCVELGHRQLSWSERISYPWLLPWLGRHTQIAQATCGECGRSQTLVRIVYPPGHTIQLSDPHSRDERRADAH